MRGRGLRGELLVRGVWPSGRGMMGRGLRVGRAYKTRWVYWEADLGGLWEEGLAERPVLGRWS